MERTGEGMGHWEGGTQGLGVCRSGWDFWTRLVLATNTAAVTKGFTKITCAEEP